MADTFICSNCGRDPNVCHISYSYVALPERTVRWCSTCENAFSAEERAAIAVAFADQRRLDVLSSLLNNRRGSSQTIDIAYSGPAETVSIAASTPWASDGQRYWETPCETDTDKAEALRRAIDAAMPATKEA